MTDHYLAAQKAAEEHMEMCLASMDDMEIEPDTLAPYCGCLTCDVREILHAAEPHLRKQWLEEVAGVLAEEEFKRIAGDQ